MIHDLDSRDEYKINCIDNNNINNEWPNNNEDSIQFIFQNTCQHQNPTANIKINTELSKIQ